MQKRGLLESRAMSHSASQKVVDRNDPAIRHEECSIAMPASPRDLQLIPLGAFHVNRSMEILEWGNLARNEFALRGCSRSELLILPKCMRHREFLDMLSSAMHSGSSSLHVDFKMSGPEAERAIHVHILAFGDTTAWLFISDRTLLEPLQ